MPEAVARVGLPPPDPETWQHLEFARLRSNIVRRYHRGELPCEAYYAEFAEASVGHYTSDQVRALHAAWIVGEYPGVARLVADLNAVAGLRTACLSNTAHAHWELMTETQAEAFPAVNQLQVKRASHLMRMVKPDLDIYEQAIRDFEVSPSEILFFDDLEENVAAARAAGITAEQVDPLVDTEPQLRTYLRAHGVAL
jgi:glucose-1-phosphatase